MALLIPAKTHCCHRLVIVVVGVDGLRPTPIATFPYHFSRHYCPSLVCVGLHVCSEVGYEIFCARVCALCSQKIYLNAVNYVVQNGLANMYVYRYMD